MYTIIDAQTGKVLFAKHDNEVLEGQVAIQAVLTEPMTKPYWDFETKTFYNNDKNNFE